MSAFDLPERVNDPDYEREAARFPDFESDTDEPDHYERPDDVAGTVFDPSSEVFGPIMAAIQAGDFEDAGDMLRSLARKTDGSCPDAEIVDEIGGF